METTEPIRILQPQIYYHSTFTSADTDTIGFIRELRAMLSLENANGYVFQASQPAYEHAEAYLRAAKAVMGRAFNKPEFTPDGEGGIDIEWENGDKGLTLSCRGRDNQTDFIYWEENGDYDGKDASLSLLIDRLNWLNHA